MSQHDTTGNGTRHPKQDFQVERLAFFSDAVFAIAITLLVIEFKVPEVTTKSTLEEVYAQLEKLLPNFLALLTSFYLIATYWIRHHFLFKHIHNYNRRIVAVNLFVLLPIIFLPFTTAFVANAMAAHNDPIVILAIRIFFLNHILVSLTIYVLYWIATVQHKEFSFRMEPKDKIKFIMETLFQTMMFSVYLIIFSISDPKGNRQLVLTLTLAVVATKLLLERYLKKRAAKESATSAGADV